MLIWKRYHIPSHLREHVDFVSPGVGLSATSASKKLQKKQKRATDCPALQVPMPLQLENCWQGVFSDCIKALYNISEPESQCPENTFGIFEPGVTYLQKDMDLFFKNFAPQIPEGTMAKNVFLNGAKMTENFTNRLLNEEANLDFQIPWPLVYPQNLTLFDVLPTEKPTLLDFEYECDGD